MLAGLRIVKIDERYSPRRAVRFQWATWHYHTPETVEKKKRRILLAAQASCSSVSYNPIEAHLKTTSVRKREVRKGIISNGNRGVFGQYVDGLMPFQVQIHTSGSVKWNTPPQRTTVGGATGATWSFCNV